MNLNCSHARKFSSCLCTAGTAVGVAAAFGAPIGGLLFAYEELATFFSQTLGWEVFFACMLSVLTEDTLRSAQNALTEGHFGLFDGEASTIFFEVFSSLCTAKASYFHKVHVVSSGSRFSSDVVSAQVWQSVYTHDHCITSLQHSIGNVATHFVYVNDIS